MGTSTSTLRCRGWRHPSCASSLISTSAATRTRPGGGSTRTSTGSPPTLIRPFKRSTCRHRNGRCSRSSWCANRRTSPAQKNFAAFPIGAGRCDGPVPSGTRSAWPERTRERQSGQGSVRKERARKDRLQVCCMQYPPGRVGAGGGRSGARHARTFLMFDRWSVSILNASFLTLNL